MKEHVPSFNMILIPFCSVLDEANPPNVVPTTIRTIESINPSEFEYLISAVMTTGQLADGEYRFELKIFSGTSSSNVVLTDQDSKTIIVESTTGVNLESPGGMLADTSFNMVYTTYPVFNWNKGNCRNCETYIRVAEFKVGYHSSLAEALRDERRIILKLRTCSFTSIHWEPLSTIFAL